ncbi:MAG: hypothetical protein H6819_08480 [Phycisphaerales bacterium]|nr:hypothetical protein [Phycisphaerales bacterium]MCB9854158.1 hypothetical protein [Phycisphaerales bacterium]MCB9864706.1 hypothetical protein [Phycisphaerales bacterium]
MTDDRSSRRFVVLFHAHPTEGDHYDLLIETDAALASWRVLDRPESATTNRSIACIQIPDHRREYLDYEGPVSGDRGDVKQHDAGHCATSPLDAPRIAIRFAGKVLKGDFVLERDEEQTNQWRLRLA